MVDFQSDALSRRTLMKRSAIGAAAVWSAPVVTSLGLSPAAAASAGLCPVPNLSTFQGDLDFEWAGQLPAGADLTQNDASPYSNDSTGFIFAESGPIEIPAGGYQSQTGLIPAGTLVCSIYIHASSRTGTFRYRGTITMPAGVTIAGYDGRVTNLQNSDPLFAVPGVNYNGAARSHEWTANAGGSGDYYGLVAPGSVEIRYAVADCCVDQGRLFVVCP